MAFCWYMPAVMPLLLVGFQKLSDGRPMLQRFVLELRFKKYCTR